MGICRNGVTATQHISNVLMWVRFPLSACSGVEQSGSLSGSYPGGHGFKSHLRNLVLNVFKGVAHMDKPFVDVYCPNCIKRYGRKKLLFQRSPDSKGTVSIMCRGCKDVMKIQLEKEPMSRE